MALSCINCGGSSLTKISSQVVSNGDIYEEYRCGYCMMITGHTLPKYFVSAQASSVYNLPASQIIPVLDPPAPQTRQDKINAYWDLRKAEAEKMPDLDKWMLYYYLNKLGLTIQGLDHKIEVELKKKFPVEAKKKNTLP